MKQYYAIIDNNGQISTIEESSISSALKEYKDFIDTSKKRIALNEMVTTGQAFHITKREARIYTRLLNEKKELTARLEKIALELGVK